MPKIGPNPNLCSAYFWAILLDPRHVRPVQCLPATPHILHKGARRYSSPFFAYGPKDSGGGGGFTLESLELALWACTCSSNIYPLRQTFEPPISDSHPQPGRLCQMLRIRVPHWLKSEVRCTEESTQMIIIRHH